jgi:multimeric flavodoxin WrbA
VSASGRRRLLVVYQARTSGAQALADAVIAGARTDEVDDVDVVVRRAMVADVGDVLAAEAVILGTTEHFGAMAGQFKDFLERIYYRCLEPTRGRPWALFVKAGHDGQGTLLGVQRIVTGLAWRAVAEPLLVVGPVTDEHLAAGAELGATVAAALSLGMW